MAPNRMTLRLSAVPLCDCVCNLVYGCMAATLYAEHPYCRITMRLYDMSVRLTVSIVLPVRLHECVRHRLSFDCLTGHNFECKTGLLGVCVLAQQCDSYSVANRDYTTAQHNTTLIDNLTVRWNESFTTAQPSLAQLMEAQPAPPCLPNSAECICHIKTEMMTEC